MSDLDRVFDKLGEVQESLEGKIDGLRESVDKKLSELHTKVEVRTDKLQAQLGVVSERLATVHACAESAAETASRVNGEFHAQQAVCAERFGRLGGARTAIAVVMSTVAVLVAAGTLIWRLLT